MSSSVNLLTANFPRLEIWQVERCANIMRRLQDWEAFNLCLDELKRRASL